MLQSSNLLLLNAAAFLYTCTYSTTLEIIRIIVCNRFRRDISFTITPKEGKHEKNIKALTDILLIFKVDPKQT